MNAPENKNEEEMHWELTLPQPAEAEAAAPALDADGFAGFYERTARPLWGYLARASGDHALAEDLAQESFVRFLASDRLAEVMAEGEVAARRFLFRIASNLLRDHWRRPAAQSVALPMEIEAADELQGNEARLMIEPVLQQMKPRERQLLWLAYAEGYAHREIAEITGLAEMSVRLLLFRARRRMLKLLAT